jgi:hypothetical protein
MSMLSRLSKQLGMDEKRVRGILLELPEIIATSEEQQAVFNAAQEAGMDINKMRIGRRIHTRKEAIEEVVRYIEAHPSWKKQDLISYMRYSISLMRRVEKKILPDFFD